MGAFAYLKIRWLRLWEARGQLFDLAYDLKWAIISSILAFAVLAAPGQIIELYRILHSEARASEFIFLSVPLLGMALAFWATGRIIAADSVERMEDPRPLTLVVSRLIPALLGALPVIGCALGHFAAQPKPLGEEVNAILARAGSPWAGIAEDLAGDLGARLPILGLTYLIAGGMLFVAFQRRRQPKGFQWLREEGARPRALLASFLLVAGLCALFTLSPVALPRAVGTFGIVALFFVALAVISTQLTLLSIRYRAPVIPALLAVAVATSILNLNDNHAIRRVDANPDHPAPDPVDVGAAFDDWYRSRPDLSRFDDEYPVYVVAAQGGGMYAAYQSAVVLARLQDSCPAFRHHLFAISSVSGGSVGAAMFTSALPRLPWPAPADTPCDRLLAPSEKAGPLERKVSDALKSDHLSPLVAATLFPDFTQRFLPFPVGPLDRARALEYSFEQSAEAAGISRFSSRFREHWSVAGSAPALVMNTTDAASGARYLIAPFRLPQRSVPIAAADRQPASTVGHFPFEKGKRDLPLSTAAMISARFPWLTPAALLPGEDGRPAVRLVDGGYVDNSGLETALDIYEELRGRESAPSQNEAPRPGPRPRFIIIAITGGGLLERNSFALGETLEPIRALLSTRVSRSYVALERAYRQMPTQEWRPISRIPVRRSQIRTVGLSNRYYDLPLGWRLSERTRRIIALQSGRGWDCEPGRYFHQVAPELAGADCVQALVSAELNQRMDQFAVEAATLNYRFAPGRKPAPKRFDHESALRCYSRSRSRPLTYRQNRLAVTVMQRWDERPDLKDERWLAFALAVLLVDSGGFAMLAERGTPEQLEQRYGPGSSWGKRLGNVEPGDGWNYRGRGLLLLTGRSNYRRAGAAIGVPELENNPDLFFSPEVSARYAFHYLFNDNRARLARIFTSSAPDWKAAGRIVWGGVPALAEQAQAESVKFHGCLKAARR